MPLIKGQTVTLYDRVQTGMDGFNHPIYEETPVDVKNVLICPVSTDDIITETSMEGKKQEYELCIPKEDTNTWENRRVFLPGLGMFQVYGFVQEWQAENTPGPWNRKVKVKRYG